VHWFTPRRDYKERAPNERRFPELVCLVQAVELQIPANTVPEIPELPKCTSKIRDEFLSKLSRSSFSTVGAELAMGENDLSKKGIATHYHHPVTGHWMEI
jgi:hypothetical protein